MPRQAARSRRSAELRFGTSLIPLSAATRRVGDRRYKRFVNRFTAALDDDLNISAAWAAVFEWVRETNRRLAENSLGAADAASALAAWDKIDSVLGIGTKSGRKFPLKFWRWPKRGPPRRKRRISNAPTRSATS